MTGLEQFSKRKNIINIKMDERLDILSNDKANDFLLNLSF